MLVASCTMPAHSITPGSSHAPALVGSVSAGCLAPSAKFCVRLPAGIVSLCPRPPMANLPRWEMCWSSFNLTSFMTWFHHHASPAEQLEAAHLHMVVHRQADCEVLAALGLPPQQVALQLRFYDGTSRAFMKQECAEPGCERCASGCRGYMFRWVDSRWTPSAALDLTLTRSQLTQEMYKPPGSSPQVPAPSPQVPSGAPRCHQVPPGAPRCPQVPPGAPRCPKCPQVPPGVPR